MLPDFIRDRLPTEDWRWYILVGFGIALLLTLQTVEAAIESAWPHQRRTAGLAPRARNVQVVWPAVALLILPGLILVLLNVAVLIWQEVPRTDAQMLGASIVGVGWLIFVAVSSNYLYLGRFMRRLGLVGPLALMALLIVANTLLVISLFDVSPSWQTVRDALPLI